VRVERTGALALYATAITILVVGGVAAAGMFPGGFDWTYRVISALASRKHNPDGAMWFAGALAVGMALLWPVATYLGQPLGRSGDRPRISLTALRFGLACGALLGIERLFIEDLSGTVRKAHELLALLTFVGLYWGMLGFYVDRLRQAPALAWPGLLVVLPLLAVGSSQLALYFGQRNLGWVDVTWRELGVPLWLSFAFWQWVAVALLLLALGHLVFSRDGVVHRNRWLGRAGRFRFGPSDT
jgi:hypothetical protein